MASRKELKEAYKRMKPEMGVFRIRCRERGRNFLCAVGDLKGRMNRHLFQLNMGSHPDKELQADWKARGSEGFDTEVLEILKYDEDESKTDYSEELELLRMDWEEKLAARGETFYGRKTAVS